MQKPIYVTQPYLPPLEEFIAYLQDIWDKKILTNGGPFHQQLEQALCDYLGVKHLALFTNAAAPPVMLPRHRVQNIDTPKDWTRAEWMFKAMQQTQ